MKMYVIVRKDIPETWYTPQACHAVAQFALDHPEHHGDWQNQNIVVLGAKTKDHFDDYVSTLRILGINFSCFCESYQDVGTTSLAFVSNKQIPAFKKLKLLR